jgi:hypothetical protein
VLALLAPVWEQVWEDGGGKVGATTRETCCLLMGQARRSKGFSAAALQVSCYHHA